MPRLTGKTMVVIGGSRGVGRQIVRAGADNGARVLAMARQADALEQLTRERPGVAVLSRRRTSKSPFSSVRRRCCGLCEREPRSF